MSNIEQNTAKPRIAYAKLVATPTQSSWSQAYNTGNLFACLSLSRHKEEQETHQEEDSLHVTGKKIFSVLEAEFFTLPEKTLQNIKHIITASLKDVPAGISANICLAIFKEDVLYVFIAGAGKIILKRDEKTGVLLEQHAGTKNILAASGYLKNNDTIVLATQQFTKDISNETLHSALELALPNDIAEALSPQIHEHDDGDQAAIIITYHGFSSLVTEEETTIEEEIRSSVYEKEETPKRPALPKMHMPVIHFPKIPHRKKLFLSIAFILIFLLSASVVMTQQKQQAEKTKALFASIYEPAKKSYDEGKSIQSLNTTKSREDFLKAEQILKAGIGKFKDGSAEQKQLADLLAQTQTSLQKGGISDKTPVKLVENDTSLLLSTEKDQKDGLAFGQADSEIYVITKTAIVRSSEKKSLIENSDDWETPKAIVPYQGNIYLLDSHKGVIKYVASAESYEKTSYFAKAPDLTKAVGMAIDGSVWILFENGSVFKYTKGESDNLKLSGLPAPLQAPTKIVTTIDDSNMYILDPATGSIVSFSKEGAFQKQYQNSILQKAKDFEVREKDKKIYILSGEKIYQIDL